VIPEVLVESRKRLVEQYQLRLRHHDAGKSNSLLLPSGTVENAVPTAADPFYNFPEWKIKLKK
jgi:hypothetical protein